MRFDNALLKGFELFARRTLLVRAPDLPGPAFRPEREYGDEGRDQRDQAARSEDVFSLWVPCKYRYN